MRDKPVFPSLVFRLTPLNTPPPGAGMFIRIIPPCCSYSGQYEDSYHGFYIKTGIGQIPSESQT